MINFKLNEDSFKSIVRLGMENGKIDAEDAILNQMVVTIKLADGAEKYITYAVNDENDQITADSGR